MGVELQREALLHVLRMLYEPVEVLHGRGSGVEVEHNLLTNLTREDPTAEKIADLDQMRSTGHVGWISWFLR